jgi:transcriptional regulator with XRE-family HTH domain
VKEITQEEFQLALGEEIRRLRDRKGWTQRKLAAKAGIHYNSLCRYEGGADIPVVTFMRLCVALGTHMIDVVERVLPDARGRIAQANGLKTKRGNVNG